ncbi:MAG: pilus assembly FimT family protein [Planctomycetota bacterium]
MTRVSGQGRSGFSIVELLVVVAIIGMVAGVSSVSWRSILPRTALNGDVRTLGARIQSTRSDSISRNQTFELVYDLDNDLYWIRPPYDDEGNLLTERMQEDTERIQQFLTQLSDGVTFAELVLDGERHTEGLWQVTFDALGSSSDHYVVLYHEAYDRYHTVEVLALTGLIRFHDGIFEREEPNDSDFN